MQILQKLLTPTTWGLLQRRLAGRLDLDDIPGTPGQDPHGLLRVAVSSTGTSSARGRRVALEHPPAMPPTSPRVADTV